MQLSRKNDTGIVSITRRLRLVLFVVALAALAGPAFPVSLGAQTSGEKQKKVFAHHMGSLNAGRGAMAWYTHNPQLGDPATSNGGDYRNLPLVPYEMTNLTLEESADLQIRRAMRAGIDGFAVNAWAGGEQAKLFLDALFKVAEEKDYPFEISICPDPNAIDHSPGFTNAIVGAIKYLLDRHGNSPKLARRDGKPIIFGYQSNWIWVEYLWRKYEDASLVEIARTTPEGWELIKDAYQQIEQLAGQPLYFQFEMGAFYHGVKNVPVDGYYRAAQVVAKHMPAVNEFLPSRHTADFARATREAGREWGHPVYFSYDNNRTNWSHGGPGSDTLRRTWQEARDNNSTLIQFSTWNDYHENTNLSPGLSTNYSYFDLNTYFIEWWKKGGAPAPTRDRVYVFSRKYGRDAVVFPFRSPAFKDGVIEVLTILPQAARIRVPGRGEYDAPAGMHVQQFPVTPGPVSAELIRNGVLQLRVVSPEPVTDKPFRQDNGIVGISSECARHWALDFGTRPLVPYSEYGDRDGDGLPNWFEMYWFGKFGDFATATAASPETIGAGGLTNLQAYEQRRSPHEGSGGIVPRQPYAGAPAVIPGKIQAENFDLGGMNVAYFDSVGHNQGGQLRSSENVDIQITTDAGGGHNVGWTTPGEWLEYTVNVVTPGTHNLNVRVAADAAGGQLRVLMGGQDISGAINVPATGGWQQWRTLTVPVTLTSGTQVMRVSIEGGGFNFNFVEFIAKATNHPPVVSITSPAANATFREGDTIRIDATASSESGVAKVEFLANGAKIGEATSSPYTFSWTGFAVGSYSLTTRAVDTGGAMTTSAAVAVVVENTPVSRLPFAGSPVRLPGRVRAAEFDKGGQGVAYHDTTTTNQGKEFRTTETVDIEATTDTGGGYNVGWTAPGEWLLYTVEVDRAAVYDLRVRVASPNSGKSFRVSFDGTATSTVNVPNTGGWQNWTTVTVPGVSLQKGLQTMQVFFDGGDINLHYVEVQDATSEAPATSWTTWSQNNFTPAELANASISGDLGDPNGNGVPNLMEYALNRDPKAPGRGPQSVPGQAKQGKDAYLTLTYTRRAGVSDISYIVEVSSDMKTWTSGVSAVTPVSVTPDGTGEVVVIRDNQKLSTTPSRFMRLRVQRNS